METTICRVCRQGFFGLREGSDLCSLHYFEFGKNIAHTKFKQPEYEPEDIISELIKSYLTETSP